MSSRARRILNNQALGLTPILLEMFLDMFLPYTTSLVIGFSITIIGLIVFRALWSKGIYQFLLIPVAIAHILYSLFLFFDIKPTLFFYFPIIAGILLVTVLIIFGIFRKRILLHANTQHPRYPRLYPVLKEAFYVALIIQNCFTLYLFVVLLHNHLPQSAHDATFELFLYHYFEPILGLLIIVYEQIRIKMLTYKLGKEIWLPVLNGQGRVVGSIPYSFSDTHKKFYHPIVRIVVIYNNMLYLLPRAKIVLVSPEQLDYPFYQYIFFRHTVESTVHDIIGDLNNDPSINPRFLIRYTFENGKVKQLVSLYTITLGNEKQVQHFTGGKWWTMKQIESELNSKIFSEYFVKEFPYLQNTILFAENAAR